MDHLSIAQFYYAEECNCKNQGLASILQGLGSDLIVPFLPSPSFPHPGSSEGGTAQQPDMQIPRLGALTSKPTSATW